MEALPGEPLSLGRDIIADRTAKHQRRVHDVRQMIGEKRRWRNASWKLQGRDAVTPQVLHYLGKLSAYVPDINLADLRMFA